MNSNLKVIGVFVLIGLAMFAYEEYEGQQRRNAFNLAQQRYLEGFNKQNEVGNNGYTQGSTSASQDYDPNAIVNEPFGISIPALADLKMLPSASKNSYTFIDARTESRNDLIMVVPLTDDLNTVAQNLQAAGTPFTKTENTVTAAISENGMIMNMVYNVSPNGGGISIMRCIMGTPAISQQTINALFNGIRFRAATASLAERQQLIEMDIQNQRIANQRNGNEVTGGDVAMERIKGYMSRSYAFD